MYGANLKIREAAVVPIIFKSLRFCAVTGKSVGLANKWLDTKEERESGRNYNLDVDAPTSFLRDILGHLPG